MLESDIIGITRCEDVDAFQEVDENEEQNNGNTNREGQFYFFGKVLHENFVFRFWE
ncbi:MCE family protein [Prevotella sp. MGM2]|nr:MCE family protein [Prevotella sp. MGM2]